MLNNLVISSNYYNDEKYDSLMNIMATYKECDEFYLINIYNLNNETTTINSSNQQPMTIVNFCKKNAITKNLEEEEEEKLLTTNFLEQFKEEEKILNDDKKITDVCFLHDAHYLLSFVDLLIPFLVNTTGLKNKNYTVDEQHHMLIEIIVQKTILVNGRIVQPQNDNLEIKLTTSYFDNTLLIHAGFEHAFSKLPINSNKKPIIFHLNDCN